MRLASPPPKTGEPIVGFCGRFFRRFSPFGYVLWLQEEDWFPFEEEEEGVRFLSGLCAGLCVRRYTGNLTRLDSVSGFRLSSSPPFRSPESSSFAVSRSSKRPCVTGFIRRFLPSFFLLFALFSFRSHFLVQFVIHLDKVTL